MVRWQSDLSPSARAQQITCLLYSPLVFGLLLLPWPPSLAPLMMVLLLLMLGELWRRLHLQRRFSGRLTAEESRIWRWRQRDYQVMRPPFILPFGILLTLRTPQGTRLSLWLMRDSMPEANWRALRRLFKGYEPG
ncbi:hypothetical protein HA40_09085 [Mixta calida]|nr:hypothetical protein PSNIH2_01945 [Pantoea sp. PSNIH2]ORM59527.1 hypothetical protein HA40_09085 [Mixta calida]